MDALASIFSVEAATTRYPLVLSCLAALFISHRLLRSRYRRSRKLSPLGERVLVLGASSGIGRAIAHEYAARGARVCVVGRREGELNAVVEECAALLPNLTGEPPKSGYVFAWRGDFGVPEDMVALRDELERRWGGLDTLVVSAGVSALRPLLEVAGLERQQGAFVPPHASVEGVTHTVEVATAAMRGNFFGPLVSAVTFIPLLSATSCAPAICQISSLAALCPAPTRSLYGSTKASSLMLYQALAIEHPNIAFTNVIPSTVEGDFRASAVDGGAVREADPNKHGLKRVSVARRSIRGIDAGEKDVLIPYAMVRFGHFGYWLWPSFIEGFARRKYNFTTI